MEQSNTRVPTPDKELAELKEHLRRGNHAELREGCKPGAELLSLIAEKWTVLVVIVLSDGPKRFKELQRSLTGVSQRMLTLTVRGLERDGLISRTVFPTVPPRVEYALTDLGESLRTPIFALGQWARDNRAVIEAARARYDRSAESAPAGDRNVSG
ncbi:helix-turn-helix transcriptional regulator [Gemmata sp. JC673]|uniref:Helix-turn-helix transcriptional regulator n=1 Tax=Gemmata algarum TaxID=2975278 RepID=A0ABU5F832_9BACT|nr:helix-turn-helix domain-containing protein [Gemmata algarum]MDY3562947.1 helix-turn-helix transcriptional regulator [Gemmata algarum]